MMKKHEVKAALRRAGWEVLEDGWLWGDWVAARRIFSRVEVIVSDQGAIARQDEELVLMEDHGELTEQGEVLLDAREAAQVAYALAIVRHGEDF